MNQMMGYIMIIGMVVISTLATHYRKTKNEQKKNQERLSNWSKKTKKKR